MEIAELAHETDWEGFRRAARSLLARQVPPALVVWQVGQGARADLFGQPPASPVPNPIPPGAGAPTVPASFLALGQVAALHRDVRRWPLLYRCLWRLVGEPALRHDTLDPDIAQLRLMARAVERDQHKMKAFLRFRALPDERFVAWFEPAHHILAAVAPFFVRRFTNMRWLILTPDGSLAWDGHQLAQGGPARREDAVAHDAHEGLWKTYYASIFNPARVKFATMCREMPRRYWRDLPEAELIAPLVGQATHRSETMISQNPTIPRKPLRSGSMSPAATTALNPMDSNADLARLAAEAGRCRRCPLWQGTTQTVWGEGPGRAGLMLVGEQPGDQEDLAGRPFVGPAGQLLDRAMAELGWDRDRIYVTNAVKHFKYELRGKRRIHKTPGQREAAACQYWLDEEIAHVQPQALVALGATATRSLLGPHVGVLANRGQWLARADGRQVLVTLHPSALLRMPSAEKAAAFRAWLEDLARATPVLAGGMG